MSNSMEEEAGKLLVCAERILRGHITLEIIWKFRTLCHGHALERLAPNDYNLVREAADNVFSKFGIRTLPPCSPFLKSGTG